VLQPYQKLTSDGVKDTAKQVVLNDLSPRSCSWDANYRILITHGVVEGAGLFGLGGNDVPIPKSALSQFDFAFLDTFTMLK